MSGGAWWAGAVALLAALMAVTRATLVHALMALVVMLVALAAMFFVLGAGFAGALQILIYAGAIVAVFLFIVMTADGSADAVALERQRLRDGWPGPAVLGMLLLLPMLFGHGYVAGPGDGSGSVSARLVGALLYGRWGLAVELVSFLLLAALLVARMLARRQPGDDR